MLNPLIKNADNQKGESPSYTVTVSNVLPKIGFVEKGSSYIVLKDEPSHKKPEKKTTNTKTTNTAKIHRPPIWFLALVLFCWGFAVGFFMMSTITISWPQFCNRNSTINRDHASRLIVSSYGERPAALGGFEEYHQRFQIDRSSESFSDSSIVDQTADNNIPDTDSPHMAMDIVVLVEPSDQDNRRSLLHKPSIDFNSDADLINLLAGSFDRRSLGIEDTKMFKENRGNPSSAPVVVADNGLASAAIVQNSERIDSNGEMKQKQRKSSKSQNQENLIDDVATITNNTEKPTLVVIKPQDLHAGDHASATSVNESKANKY